MTLEERQINATRRPDPDIAVPVIASGETFGHITTQISAVPLKQGKLPALLYITLAAGLGLLFLLTVSTVYLLGKGVGIFGIEIPVAWGYMITNFVWWIGIGH